jgi:FkbM family methyltransferase
VSGSEAWLRNLPDLLGALDVEPRGLIHLGAGDGREMDTYLRLGFGRVVLVEPIPYRAADLRARARQLRPEGVRVDVVEAAIATLPGPSVLNVTGHDEASSLLTPIHWPVVSTVGVRTVTLAELDLFEVNVLVADVQGAEVDALRSASPAQLRGLDLCIVEATDEARYDGGASRADVDAFFVDHGWQALAAFPHDVEPWVVDTAYVPAVPR